VYWTNGDKLLRANLDGSSIETVVSGLTEPAGIALNFNYAPETPAVTIPVYQNQAADIILPVIDYENDPLSFSDIVSPVHGALIGVPPNLTYTPGPNFIGHDSLTYTASDNHGGSNTGMVRFSIIRPAEPDSIITMPGQGAVLTNTAPISVAGSASAVDYLKSLTVTVDNAVVYTRSFAPATVTDTTWTTTWDPAGFGEGAHTLVSVVSDQNNTLQTDIHPISVWLDLGLPAIAITPTLLTGSHKLPQPGMVALRGVVSDTAAVASVQIRVNGGAWEPATVAGSTWTYAWPVEGSLDGQAYTVSGLVSDVAGQTDQITETVTVDVVPPSPVTVTLAYTNSGGVRVPVSPGQTIVDSPITLSIDWTASSDGAGLAGYLAGWTLSDTPDPAFLTQYGTTARHHAQVPGEAQILYAHLMVQDVNGNTTRQTLGPIYVDAPTTPDLIDDFAYRGWMSGGGSQIGKDREISRTTTLPPQALYVSWNADNLRLTWSGANWDGDGDLFIYLDTGPGGAGAAYNPYADALPAVGLGITANYLLWVEDGDTATLLNWNGATWVVDTVLTPANFQLDMAIRPAHTDLLIPFSWLGINNPAAAALNLVAFANEEGSLDLWATMPSHNPLNSLRVTSPIIEPQTVNLTRSYAWPSLGPNQTPNAGQFADTDLLVTISSAPAGISVGYLADDLLDLLPPGGRLDADLNGVLDIGLPFSQDVQPLAVGQPVTYTVHYENRGSQTAGGATVLATALGPLSFDSGSSKLISLPDIGPAISGTVTFTATVTNPGASVELNAQVADAFHGPFEWWWLQHDVDIAPPTGLTILPSFTYVRSLTNTTLGLVQDPSGVPAITLEITTLPDNGVNIVTCLDDSPRDGLWACNWSLGPITSISQVALRAKATDGAGNITPAWSDPITLTVDTTPPTVTLDAALESLFANGFIAAGPVTLNGTVADDRQATGVELCDQGTNCVQVGVTPGNTASGVWIHPFAPVAEGDGITGVLVLYGLDAAGNRSAPLTRAYRIDTIPPVITVTNALSQVTLPGSSAVMAGTVAGSEFVAEPPTPTPTAIPEPASLPRPTVTPENPAFSLRDNAIYLPVILGGGLRRAQPSGQRVEVIETVEPVRRAHVEPVVTTGPEVAAPEAPIMVQKLAAIPILSGAYSDSGGFSQLYGQVQGPDGSITWSVAERDATTWRFWLPPVETPGQYKITLEAWDMAGNSRSYGPFSLTVTVNGGGGNSFDLYLPIVMK
jgi:hypothetical protein